MTNSSIQSDGKICALPKPHNVKCSFKISSWRQAWTEHEPLRKNDACQEGVGGGLLRLLGHLERQRTVVDSTQHTEPHLNLRHRKKGWISESKNTCTSKFPEKAKTLSCLSSTLTHPTPPKKICCDLTVWKTTRIRCGCFHLSVKIEAHKALCVRGCLDGQRFGRWESGNDDWHGARPKYRTALHSTAWRKVLDCHGNRRGQKPHATDSLFGEAHIPKLLFSSLQNVSLSVTDFVCFEVMGYCSSLCNLWLNTLYSDCEYCICIHMSVLCPLVRPKDP